MVEKVIDVDEIWAGDLLERKIDADFLIHFLISRVEERERVHMC